MKKHLFILLIAIVASFETAFSTITVRFEPNSASEWNDEVYLYAWTQEGSKPCGEWPGTKVSKDDEGWWSFTFDESIDLVNIIWSHKGQCQTRDITGVTNSTCYALQSSQVEIINCLTGEPRYIDEVLISGLNYQIDTERQTAEVISKSGDKYTGDIVIPASVEYESISYSVTSIGYRAFYECYGLTSVNIPNSVTSIGNSAFETSSGLANIVVENGNTIYDSRNNCNAIIETASNTLVFGCKNTIIPNSVTSIGGSAFSGCSGLTSIEIPNSVTSIGSYAFNRCSGLTSIEIPNSVTSIGSYAFNRCSGLTSVSIPNSVTSIGYGAFIFCTGLTSIEIPNSVTSIGSFAFFYCTGLISLTIPSSVPNDISWKISGCKYGYSSEFEASYNNLQQIEAPAWFFDVPESDWTLCPKYLEHVTINNGELNDNIYGVIKRSYKTLKSIDISGVSNITLADEAFKDNYKLTELVLPAGLTSVSYMAVAGCKNLKSIDIPASVEEIDQSAFEDCRSIETITFGGKQPSSKPGLRLATASTESQLRKIGNWAFYNAHELQHLEIPEGVTEIGDAAFYGCTYLQDLSLPKTVNRIGDNCFALCSHLERIDVGALTPPTIFARTFFDVSRKIPVYVPEDVMLDYLNDPYWKEMNIQGTPTGIEEVGVQPSAVSTQKVLRNGQLYILRNGEIYNATGARVE